MKKILLVSLGTLIFIISGFFVCNFFNQNKILREYEDLVEEKIAIIDNILNKYQIGKTGNMKVLANYKGAHGENYPAQFEYNYELSQELYFENTQYSFIHVNLDFFKIIDVLKNLKNIDTIDYKFSKKDGVTSLIYDDLKFNEVFNTDFKSIEVSLKTEGILKKFKEVNIYIDDIYINISGKDIRATYKDLEIFITLDKEASYVNINNKLKMNIFTKDSYNFSIVLNNQVYSVILKEDGMNVLFNTGASIYNSIAIDINYKDISLNKNEEMSDFKENPIIRYLEESNLSLR